MTPLNKLSSPGRRNTNPDTQYEMETAKVSNQINQLGKKRFSHPSNQTGGPRDAAQERALNPGNYGSSVPTSNIYSGGGPRDVAQEHELNSTNKTHNRVPNAPARTTVKTLPQTRHLFPSFIVTIFPSRDNVLTNLFWSIFAGALIGAALAVFILESPALMIPLTIVGGLAGGTLAQHIKV